MFKNNKGKLLAVIFTVVCMFVAMLGGFVGLFTAVDTTPTYIADAATAYQTEFNGYYQSLEDDLTKTGTTFRSQLASLITSTHTTLTTYKGLMNVWDDSDVNSEGKLIQFYTGYLVSVPSDYNSGTNREHVWPKNNGNAFDAESRVGSDAHHLRPANTNLNSSRGSKNFDEFDNGTLISQSAGSNPCYTDGTFFYPGVGYRGATARILMYVQTRWGDEYNLKFVLGNGYNKTIGDIETLMKWHIEEPPTAEEIKRNNGVAKVQGNRNPFIDHPEYAEMIYCYDGQDYNDELQAVVAEYGSYLNGKTDDTLEVESISLSTTSATLTTGETMTISASVTPSNAVDTVTWTSSNPSVASVNATTGVITALSAGTATITATSTKTPSVKATATITVKAISAITISGTPTKKSYEAGEQFNPIGITVTATYTDTTTAVIPNAQITWLDGTTRQTTLSVGTTSIIAKYGNFEKTVTGITVAQSTTSTLTITRNSFTGSGAYAWVPWSSGGVSGYGFMYPGNSGQIQLNVNKTAKYIYNTTPLSGGIKSITIKGTNEKIFEIRTSSTPFAQNSGGATGGTKRGDLTISTDGATLTIDTTDQYFAITYSSEGGAVYLDEIIITYGVIGGSSCSHEAGNWIVDQEATCNVAGSKHTECTKCGEVVDVEEIPTNNNHSWGNWTTSENPSCSKFGKESHECSVCHDIETRDIPKTDHQWGNWVDNGNGTETRVCTSCQEPETRDCANLSKIEEFESAVDSVANASGFEAKLSAINAALSKYYALSDAEKDASSETYALLESLISEYNAQVVSVNEQSKKATSDAIALFASSLSILAAIAYLFSKRV